MRPTKSLVLYATCTALLSGALTSEVPSDSNILRCCSAAIAGLDPRLEGRSCRGVYAAVQASSDESRHWPGASIERATASIAGVSDQAQRKIRARNRQGSLEKETAPEAYSCQPSFRVRSAISRGDDAVYLIISGCYKKLLSTIFVICCSCGKPRLNHYERTILAFKIDAERA